MAAPAGGLVGRGMSALVGRALRSNALEIAAGRGVPLIDASPATNALTRVTGLAAKGAEQGAVANVVAPHDTQSTAGDRALQGAEVGAVAGPVLAGASKLTSGVFKAGKAAVEPWANAMFQRPADNAANIVAQRLAQDPQFPNRLLQMSRSQAPFVVGDMPSATALTGRVFRQGGDGGDLIGSTLIDRDQGAGNRIVGHIENDISNGGSAYDTTQALTATRKAAAAPLYDRAYAAPVISSPELDAILATPAGKQALSRAATIAANEGRDPKAMGFVINDKGEVVLDPTVNLGQAEDGSLTASQDPLKQRGYTTQTLDYVKQGLDDIIEQKRDGTTGKLNLDPSTAAVNGVKNRLLREMDKLNPDYKAARAAYSGPSASMDALAMGRTAIGQRPEITRQQLAGLSEGDRAFYKQGAADEAIRRVNGTSRGGNEALKLDGNTGLENSLAPLFDTPEQHAAFVQKLRDEAQMFATKRSVMGGSDTAGRVAEDSSPLNQPSTLGHLTAAAGAAAGHPLGAMLHLNNALQNAAMRIMPRTNLELSRILTSPLDGEVGQNALQRVAMTPQQMAAKYPNLARFGVPAGTIEQGNVRRNVGSNKLSRASASLAH